ncbi:pyridoxamine 5'-phosphate oxidase [Actinoplanes lutulentus]|uniref:Pyridoxamine 5'-phosphate oxidase n=1 Tax=Actinoplanes lutulentus TaxID=1287878 RepID=A0A327ZLQ0_9ACTN|nr:pyridoxal 5'-phosphate synthase [Actinoplanes lutulentus]MBB2940962.1 pyridoxamine 5'-phosphate oxidase [Actinoplanes lutulentus]RAK43271.1 pyridoxamine 5'-phosphate oxidase [Actinoplanes lutulentus]
MSIRHLLRGLPVLAGPLPSFDAGNAPEDPRELFVTWLAEAVEAGVREPHVVTLATAGADGRPDTRVLMLRELDDRGWQFATAASSAKGRQLAENPWGALNFHWREQGRQIRVRGNATPLDQQFCAADFLSRPDISRAASLAGRQSAVLGGPEELKQALAAAEERLRDDPGVIAEDYTVYVVSPVSVEFWQGDADRRHVRLHYRREGDSWIRERLWP